MEILWRAFKIWSTVALVFVGFIVSALIGVALNEMRSRRANGYRKSTGRAEAVPTGRLFARDFRKFIKKKPEKQS